MPLAHLSQEERTGSRRLSWLRRLEPTPIHPLLPPTRPPIPTEPLGLMPLEIDAAVDVDIAPLTQQRPHWLQRQCRIVRPHASPEAAAGPKVYVECPSRGLWGSAVDYSAPGS